MCLKWILEKESIMQTMPITVHENFNQLNSKDWIVKDVTEIKPENVKNDVLSRVIEKLIGDGFSVKKMNREECKIIGVTNGGDIKTFMYDYLTYSSVDKGNCIGFYLRGSTNEGLYSSIDDPRITVDGYESVTGGSYTFVEWN
jgi:hypothetical protein